MHATEKGPSHRGSAPSDREIAASFFELLRSMKRYLRERFPPFPQKGLSEEKLRCLAALRFLGNSHLKSLAAYDGLSPSSQCILLNQLVRDGLVSRRDDPADRRNVYYELTRSGVDLVDAAVTMRIGFLCDRLAGFRKEEKARFARALAIVLSAVEKFATIEGRL